MENGFKALNDHTRRVILELLLSSEKTAGEIAEVFDISKPSISHHLELLKKGNLVKSKKKGQFIVYSINIEGFDILNFWISQFKEKEPIGEKPRIRLPLN